MALANNQDALPTVNGSADRDLRFPNPATDFKVYNKATGQLQRWTGTTYVDEGGVQRGVLDAIAYGADPTGVADASAVLQALIDAAEATGGVARIPSGTYKLNTGLTADLGRCSIEGVGRVRLDCSGMTSGYALDVSSSNDSVDDVFYNFQQAVRNLAFVGVKAANVHGLRIDNATLTRNAELRFEGVTFRRFDRAIEIGRNAWRLHFKNCYVEDGRTGGHYVYTIRDGRESNSGEVLQFDHCQFAGNQLPLTLAFGQWRFLGCSLLNCTLAATDECDVSWDHGNLENPANATVYRYLNVSGAKAVVTIRDTTWIVNTPQGGGNFTTAPATVAAGACLILDGVRYSVESTNAFESDAAATGRTWVVGSGSVISRHGRPFGSPSTWSTQPSIGTVSALNSLIHNGDGEVNSSAMWSNTGGTGTFARSTASPRSGTGHYRVTLTAGQANEWYQVLTVTPGTCLVQEVWAKLVSGSGTLQFGFAWLDQAGNVISRSQPSGTTPTAGYAGGRRVWADVVPAGVVRARAFVYAAESGSGATMDFDDWIVNEA